MTTTRFDPDTTTVGQLARRSPAAIRVLERLGIDACCGGDRLALAACADLGLSTTELLDEIDREERVAGAEPCDWETIPLGELCARIVRDFHEPLRAELPALRALSAKVAAVHGEHDPRLVELAEVVARFADGIEDHMRKEERTLFPLIANGMERFAGPAMARMRREHADHGDELARMASLTDGYVPSAGACASWRSLCERLHDLDRAMKEHVMLENNVLFPRAAEPSAPLKPRSRALKSG